MYMYVRACMLLKCPCAGMARVWLVAYIYGCIHTYIYIYIYKSLAGVSASNLLMRVHVHVYVLYIHVRIYVYAHIWCMRMYKQPYTYNTTHRTRACVFVSIHAYSPAVQTTTDT